MVHLRVRVDEELYRQIEEAAQAHGVSATKEVVSRLNASFAGDAIARPRDQFGGQSEAVPELSGLLKVLGTVMDVAGKWSFGADAIYAPESLPNWLDDPSGYAAAFYAAVRVLEELQPPTADLPLELDGGLDDTNKMTGEDIAKSILRRIASDESRPPRTEALRTALGPLVGRIHVSAIEAQVRDLQVRFGLAPRSDVPSPDDKDTEDK
jgi:hypothetical protein